MGKQAQLDHVVLLLPYEQLQNLPGWVTKHFTHADGKTENKLVLFRDGTYLELIAFVNDDSEKRKGHWWDKPYGVVDFALTNLDYDAVTSRLEQTSTNISYEAPKSGGRTKPDGTELKWQVTFPTGIDRGAVPFWCEDETPRARRVPATAENTTHACGVAGMAGVMLEVKREQVQRLAEANAAIAGVGEEGEGAKEYEVGAPNGVEGLDAPSIRVKQAGEGAERELQLTLVLQTPEHRRQEAIREEVGDGVVAISFE